MCASAAAAHQVMASSPSLGSSSHEGCWCCGSTLESPATACKYCSPNYEFLYTLAKHIRYVPIIFCGTRQDPSMTAGLAHSQIQRQTTILDYLHMGMMGATLSAQNACINQALGMHDWLLNQMHCCMLYYPVSVHPLVTVTGFGACAAFMPCLCPLLSCLWHYAFCGNLPDLMPGQASSGSLDTCHELCARVPLSHE